MHNKNKKELLLNQDIEKKVETLLSKMTLTEKAGQLTQVGTSIYSDTDLSYENEIREGKIGSILSKKDLHKINELQRIAVEESRLGIPLLFGEDIIHGYKTIFPIPLAEACSFEPELARKTAATAAKEAKAMGIHWTFAPMVDIARDPRWGRISEGSGEDTYLGCLMAKARVEGFQGDDFTAPDRIAACTKHFAAYGGCIGGRDYNTVDMSQDVYKRQQLNHHIFVRPYFSFNKVEYLYFINNVLFA